MNDAPLLLIIPTPKPRPRKAPRRSGPNSLGGTANERVHPTRLGAYDLELVQAACDQLKLSISEFLRECAVKAARALLDGRTGMYPHSREYVEPTPGRLPRD